MFPDNENKTTLTNLRKIHNPTLLDRLDAWTDKHPKTLSVVGAAFILVMITVALNLGVGRPWF